MKFRKYAILFSVFGDMKYFWTYHGLCYFAIAHDIDYGHLLYWENKQWVKVFK